MVCTFRGYLMHVGIILKKLTEEEIQSKTVKIQEKDKEMFPKEGVLFFIESYEDYYGCHLLANGDITGLEDWFENMPVKQNDYIIISKYSEGYYLTTTSDIVDKEKSFELEMERILFMEPEDILCPNCRYTLEHGGKGSKEGTYILKCARCGFTLIKKSYSD
ncbi:MAG: hypothetical protein ACTSUR_05495 [Candidatus Heimdallarchaeaceae archaeon]